MPNKTAQEWRSKHGERYGEALRRIAGRGYWSAFPEMPSEKIHGEGSNEAGRIAFESRLGKSFALEGYGTADEAGGEISPYGIDMGARYPLCAPRELADRAEVGGRSLASLEPEERIGIALEALDRLWGRSFELAYSVMHTTGQGFMMAFQAGAPHALDRALEAVAYAGGEMERVPKSVRWEKPQGKRPPIVLEKGYRVMPRGIGLVIACSTFPTWNSYPGIFADLACGNPVIVKPHPGATLPLAITVEVLRDTLADAGLSRDAALLAADTADRPAAKELALDPRVKVIDYTGGSAFGQWLESNATQARVFAEKSGVNCALVGELAEPEGMARNLAFALSLYSGQMCTTPQNIFVPRRESAKVAEALKASLDGLLGDDARAAEILGAIQSGATMRRLARAESLPRIACASRAVAHPRFGGARVRTPHVAILGKGDAGTYREECFGPVAYLVEVEDEREGLEEMRICLEHCGALSACVYADDADFVEETLDLAARAGVNAAANLSGDRWSTTRWRSATTTGRERTRHAARA